MRDVALLGAAIAAAMGYAEGSRLSQSMGGWQVICWALVLSAPFVVLPVSFAAFRHGLVASPTAWFGFGYVSLMSQLLAFFAWYHGLALGGVARVSQIQLLQPFLTILASGVWLGETVTPFMVGSAIAVVTTIFLGKKAAIQRMN
jgi:drug/metabolite transporter (DMT)-like permease